MRIQAGVPEGRADHVGRHHGARHHAHKVLQDAARRQRAAVVHRAPGADHRRFHGAPLPHRAMRPNRQRYRPRPHAARPQRRAFPDERVLVDLHGGQVRTDRHPVPNVAPPRWYLQCRRLLNRAPPADDVPRRRHDEVVATERHQRAVHQVTHDAAALSMSIVYYQQTTADDTDVQNPRTQTSNPRPLPWAPPSHPHPHASPWASPSPTHPSPWPLPPQPTIGAATGSAGNFSTRYSPMGIVQVWACSVGPSGNAHLPSHRTNHTCSRAEQQQQSPGHRRHHHRRCDCVHSSGQRRRRQWPIYCSVWPGGSGGSCGTVADRPDAGAAAPPGSASLPLCRLTTSHTNTPP